MYKLLIADDEHLIRNGLANSIDWHGLGFEVSGVAANGQEALSHIAGNLPDAIITDIRMPVMDGLELMSIVKSRYPDIKIITLSGYNDFVYAQKCIEYGVFSYILKPINDKELTHVFTTLLEELNNRKKSSKKIAADENELSLAEQFFFKLAGNSFIMTSDLEEMLTSNVIPIHQEYQCILSFSRKSSGNDRDDRQLLQESRKYWAQYHFPVLVSDHIFLVLIHSSAKMYNKDSLFYAERFKAFIETVTEDAVKIGIGNVYSLSNINASYREAMQALKTIYFIGNHTIIRYSDLEHINNQAFDDATLKKLVEELVSYVVEGELQEAGKKTRELLWDFLYKNCSSINMLHLKCIELYVSLNLKIEQAKGKINVMSVDSFYGQLAAFDSFEQLAAYVKQTVHDIALQIKELKTGGEHSLITKVKDFMANNYKENISLANLSHIYYINPSYLSTLFKKETGINFSEYTIHLRIDQAKNLLKNSDSSIQEISEEVGYSDYRYFCTIFKKMTGDTPLKYRMKSIF